MRRDMNKKLVERGRLGGDSSGVRARWKRENPEEAPRREPMRPRGRFHYRKELNENLAPLVRFLESKCGQVWDKVYSEMRREFKPDSAINYHIYQHLWDYVDKHKDQKPPWRFRSFYIDDHGILRRHKQRMTNRELKERRQRRMEALEERLVMVRPGVYHARHPKTGLWFEIEAIPRPFELVESKRWTYLSGMKHHCYTRSWDAFLRADYNDQDVRDFYGGRDLICVRVVRCLSKKEIPGND